MGNNRVRNLWPIRFRSEILQSKFLEPVSSEEYVEKTHALELRFDPLTGLTCRLVSAFPLKMVRRPDLKDIVQRSLESVCPFCPPTIETVIPRFPSRLIPEGNIRKGEALVFPNARPYDTYSAVVAISKEHYISLTDFTLDIVLDALMAAHTYLGAVQKTDPRAKYNFLAWNYLPPSGGSIIHPHIQCNAGYFPTPYQKQILKDSQKYYRRTGKNFWSDLLDEEKKRGQRYIGTIGNTCWITSFAPRGRLTDILAIFQGKSSVNRLVQQDLCDFTNGLLKVFRYMDELNIPSFNLSSYSGLDENQFWAHIRIMPRSLLLYSSIETSDQFYYQVLHDENICLLPPEIACENLKRHFRD
jgi:UDPglucose--hexose-1-phosphate uridylyltransferase